MISIGEDHVTISDAQGEIVHWVEDEWMDDPTVTLAIANAINIYHTTGPMILRAMIGKRLEGGEIDEQLD